MSGDSPEITVRSGRVEDAEAVHRIYSGPQALRGTLQLPFTSPTHWRERLEKPRDGAWQIVACAGEIIVGHLFLCAFGNRPRRKHAGTLGMAVDDAWHRRGVGSALMAAAVDMADNWLNLTRLELEVFSDNAAAIALYEKFGFTREGTCREFAFRDGELADVDVMARLKNG